MTTALHFEVAAESYYSTMKMKACNIYLPTMISKAKLDEEL
jgi:hypothetical protein